MTYYRLAFQDLHTSKWVWKTTTLTSLQAVFQLLRAFSALPQDSIHVFTASSIEDLDVMLSQENNGLASHSVTAKQFLQERHINVLEFGQRSAEQPAAAQATQPGASVATWARELWERHATGGASAAEPGASVPTSLPGGQALTTTGIAASLNSSLQDQKRLEIERGPGGDHDTPYRFTLPLSMKERLAWAHLQSRVYTGEILP